MYRFLSLGAGVQSSAIAEMVVEGELPPITAAIFADTGDEPAYVYRQLLHLAERLATVEIPLLITSRSYIMEDIYAGGRFAAMPLISDPEDGSRPGRLRRQCTNEYKIEPLQMAIRRFLLRHGLTRRYRDGKVHPTPQLLAEGVEIWIGITLDEAERMKRSRVSWMRHRWPLIEHHRMTRADCIAWLQARGLPVPGKSSCRHCPYHSNAYWRAMQEQAPGDWQQVVQFDHDLRNGNLPIAATANGTLYLHYSAQPLEEALDGRQPGLFPQTADLCGGYCWT